MSWLGVRPIQTFPSTGKYCETYQVTLGVEVAGTMQASVNDPEVRIKYAGGPTDALVLSVEGVGQVAIPKGETRTVKAWKGSYPLGTKLTVNATVHFPQPSDPSDTVQHYTGEVWAVAYSGGSELRDFVLFNVAVSPPPPGKVALVDANHPTSAVAGKEVPWYAVGEVRDFLLSLDCFMRLKCTQTSRRPHPFLLSLDCFRCLFIAASFIWFSLSRVISFL